MAKSKKNTTTIELEDGQTNTKTKSTKTGTSKSTQSNGKSTIGKKESTSTSKKKTTTKKLVKKVKTPSLAEISKTSIIKQHDAISEAGLFDRQWYINSYRDLASLDKDPLEHYLKYGANEGRNPNGVFDSFYYLKANKEVADANINPLYHYLVKGQFEKCYQNKKEEFTSTHSKEQLEVFESVKNSYFYVEDWYKFHYPDVIGTQIEPVVHFVLHGAAEGRNPGPDFNTRLYSLMYSDVRNSDINPLYHYIKFGSKESRRRFPVDGSKVGAEWIVDQIRESNLFDIPWYLEQNSDIDASGMEAIEHWVRFGCQEGRNPSPTFDLGFYYNQPNVRESRLNPLIHYKFIGSLHGYPTMDVVNYGIAVIRDSELFDADWYIKNNPDLKGIQVDPVEHYVKFGANEGRNPSANFYTKFYKSQLDPAEQGLNPLAHYITIGKERGLPIAPGLLEIAPALPTGKVYGEVDLAKNQPGTIAVAAHIFYDDMCPDFCKYFANIPYQFDLLVSTNTKAKKKNIEKAFKDVPNILKLDVRTTPNRGRDLAPMVVEFYKECLEHDYVLHIHSKKSPYGSEVAGWFEHCMDHLADSTLYVDSVFQQFRDDENLGIVYPPAFPGVVSHMAWGNMLPEAKKLLTDLEIPETVLEKFPLDFPSGSMIWFRSEALKPLFLGKFKWTDFPDEKGQKDETLAHVIERLFFYIADYQGYTRKSFRPALDGDYFLSRLLKGDKNYRTFPTTNTPQVSIIIPVYNQWEYTSNCLASISDHTDFEQNSYEIIIADDGSSDETVNVEKHFKGIKVVKTPENLGFLGNCNNAAEHATGKYVLFLNNDTQVQPYWLSTLVDVMEKDEKVGIVGSKLVYPDGTLQEAGGIIWTNASGMNYGRNKQPNDPAYCYVKESDYISGAAILVRKTFWDKVGGFDKRYTPAYYEDTDLAFQTRNEGLKVCLQPASQVVHFEGKSHGTDVTSGIKKYQVVNKELFQSKWEDVLKEKHHKNGSNLMWARERSNKGKVVAILDYYLPEYDRHAGARHTWDYIKLLVEEGYTVKFFACVVESERQLLFAREMEQMGVETFYPSRIYFEQNWSEWIIAHKDYYDAIIINRPHVAKMHIDACKEIDICTLYFCHDIHSLREKREAERHGIESNINLKSSEEYEKSIFKEVDFAYTPSIFEEEYVKDHFGIKQITYLPLYLLDQKTTKRKSKPEGKELVFVGGMRHAPNIDGIQWFLDKVWPLVLKKEPKAVMNVVGSGVPDELWELNSEAIKIHGGVSEEKLNELYHNANGVVIPLLFGAGVKGKTVEALKLGIPTVSTSIGIEGIPEIEKVLKGADTEKDFAAAVVKILNMKEVDWLKNSASLQSHADKYFSKKEGWKFLKKGLDLIKKAEK